MIKRTSEENNTRIIKIPIKRAKPIDVAYAEYQARMGARGLESSVKSFENWPRKIKMPDGTDKVVAGDTGESKNGKGSRLGTKYLNDAIVSLRRLKHLANSQYELTQIQKDTILLELENVQRELAYTFEGTKHIALRVDLAKIV